MKHIILNNKTYKVRGSVHAVKYIIKKYFTVADDKIGFKDSSENLILEFSIESIWKLIVRRKIFKPYVFYFLFKRYVDIEDIRKAQDIILPMLYGIDSEDKEPENVKAV